MYLFPLTVLQWSTYKQTNACINVSLYQPRDTHKIELTLECMHLCRHNSLSVCIVKKQMSVNIWVFIALLTMIAWLSVKTNRTNVFFFLQMPVSWGDWIQVQEKWIWPRGYKAFFRLNSAEHGICLANKSQILRIPNSFLLKIARHETEKNPC